MTLTISAKFPSLQQCAKVEEDRCSSFQATGDPSLCKPVDIKWSQSISSDCSVGVKRDDLPGVIRLIKDSLNLPDPKLSEGIATTLQEIAMNCGKRGLSSTVYGDINATTAFFGLFHCLEDEDGTVTVSFVTHTLFTTQVRTHILPHVKVQQGLQGAVTLGTGWTADEMARPAFHELRRIGVYMGTGSCLLGRL